MASHSQLRRRQTQLIQTLAGLTLLQKFQEQLDLAATKDELVRHILRRARALRQSQAAAVILVQDETLEFKVEKVSPRSMTRYVQDEIDQQVDADVFAWVVNQRKPALVRPRSALAPGGEIRTIVLVPLIAGFQMLGVLLVATSADEVEIDGEPVRLLSMASKQLALTLRNRLLFDNLWKQKVQLEVAHNELRRKVQELELTRDQLEETLHEVRIKTSELEQLKAELELKVEERTRDLVAANKELDRLSSLDGLTGVYNRRHLEESLARENERAHRYDVKTTILVFDLNGLKGINDRHGHLMGDLAIKEAAQLLQRTARRTDVVARFGGDEFVVIAPHTGNAEGFVQRVQDAIDEWNGQNPKPDFELSLSVGYATADKHMDLFTALQKADEAMYRNKQAYYNARGGRPRNIAPVAE